METLTGLDASDAEGFGRFKGKAIGLVCHQASISRDMRHVLDLVLPHHCTGRLKIQAVFGPQHGVWGHTQDNMVEWQGYQDPRTGLTFHSLYGEHRKPTPQMLSGIDELVFDLQDVGSRYYTFIWTLALCIEACQEQGISVTVLDRPNPINGVTVEGPGHDPAYKSFVGLHALPVRHAMTVGEIALHLQQHHYPAARVSVVPVQNWRRSESFHQTGLPWGLPSPNMPTQDTALVYPGQCLLEGTKLSEGRGTTRPFELFGAPFIDGWKLADHLNALALPGVWFRAVRFLPTFQKFAGSGCGGCFIHVTDPEAFRPVLTSTVVMAETARLWPDDFAWQDPPYEYEHTLLPIDILAGGPGIRNLVDTGASPQKIREWIDADAATAVGQRAGTVRSAGLYTD